MGIFSSKFKFKLSSNSNLTKITEQDKAILLLKQQRDKLKQYQKRLNNQLEKEKGLAIQLVKNGQKERALLLLRKKKFIESLLNKSEGELNNVEQMVYDIEFSIIETKVVDSLKSGNEALKLLNSILDINQIEEILYETKEGMEKQKQINELIQKNNLTIDDDDLLTELEQYLTVEELAEVPKTELKQSLTVEELPKVPKTELKQSLTVEELPKVPKTELKQFLTVEELPEVPKTELPKVENTENKVTNKFSKHLVESN